MAYDRFFHFLVTTAVAVGLVSCSKSTPKSGSSEDVSSLLALSESGAGEEQVAALQTKIAALETENRELQSRLASMSQLRSAAVEDGKKSLEDSRNKLAEAEQLVEKLKSGQREAMLTLVKGLPVGSVSWGGRAYTGVVLASIEGEEVRFTHDAGTGRAGLADLPAAVQFLLGASAARGEAQPVATTSPEVSTASASTFSPETLLIITTDAGTGSGFIAKVDGKFYAYTNAHVLCGTPGNFSKKLQSVTTANGTKLALPFHVELSNEFNPEAPHGLEDLARFEVVPPKGAQAYELVARASDALSPKTDLVAYGNSMGSGAITELAGKCMAVGPDRIEISCQIVPGNSGGPVVDLSSRKVVGVSTYADSGGRRNIWSKSTQFEGIRRFAVRPERVTKWRKMELTSLYSSIDEFRQFDRDTLTLAAACFLRPRNNRTGFDTPSDTRGDYIVRDIVIDGAKHRLGSTVSGGISRVNQRLGGAGTVISSSYAAPVYSEFYSSVMEASRSQLSSLRTADRAPYMKQHTAALAALREHWMANFQESASRMASSIR